MEASSIRGVNRVLAKLHACIDAGQYYEAHQMYRTLYFRYTAKQKYSDLLNLLYEGALLLLNRSQQASGADLSILLVDVLNKSESGVTPEYIEKLAKLYSLLENESPERMTFLTMSLKWSSKNQSKDELKQGDPTLHALVAVILWKEKNYGQARYHFLHSSDGHGCASMLVEYHITKGYPSEVDLFITQAVLQYLCLRDKATASVTFFNYADKHPEITAGPPFILPLLNFVWFLLLAVESGKLPVFSILCEQYEPSIRRDPLYTEYLDRIGQLFFGLPPPKRKTNALGDLLSSLFNGMNDDEGDSGDEGRSPNSSTNLVQNVGDHGPNRKQVISNEDLD